MILRKGCWLSWCLLFCATSLAEAQPSFTLNGSAVVVSENCYRITSHNVSNDVGSLWCEYPIQLEHALDVRFAINLGCSKFAGEGMAFVLHSNKEGYSALGCGGAALGFASEPNCSNGIGSSLAVEFDSKYTRGQPDLTVPHLALIRDGNQLNPLIAAKKLREKGPDVRDCEYHEVQILWLPSKQLFSVYFDGVLRLSYKADLQNTIFGGEKNIYLGFTGSTSEEPNMQMVCVQSIAVSIDEIFAKQKSFEQGVGIFPNPIREKLTIDVDFNAEQYVQIQLYDATGKLVYEIPAHSVRKNQYYFNLPGLPTGIYYVTVTNGTHRVSKKIVHVSTIRA